MGRRQEMGERRFERKKREGRKERGAWKGIGERSLERKKREGRKERRDNRLDRKK